MPNNLQPSQLRKGGNSPLFRHAVRHLLSWKIRRLIFLSSLYGVVRDVNHVDKENAKRLVKALNIAIRPDSVQLPVAVKSVIWSHRVEEGIYVGGRHLHVQDLGSHEVKDGEREELAKWVIKKMPDWLHYAKSAQMLYDVKRMSDMMVKVKFA